MGEGLKEEGWVAFEGQVRRQTQPGGLWTCQRVFVPFEL